MPQRPQAGEYAAERERMVREQIERRGIRDPLVLEAMRRVPRHLFVSPEQQPAAYDDHALPIGEGQTISQPFMVAVMTADLAIGPSSHVLEIGTGSGYQGAILAAIAASVVTLERRPALAERARAIYERLGISTIDVIVGDGTCGYPSRAPYDAIVVTAGAPRVPPALREQLAVGGHLVVPVGAEMYQDLKIVTRHPDRFEERTGEACVFVPLIGEQGWNDFRRNPPK